MNRGSPSALKYTVPSTVIFWPQRVRKTSISRKSGCSRPGRWRPSGSQRRNPPLPRYLISSSHPLTTNAFGAIMFFNRLFSRTQTFSASLNRPRAERCGTSSYKKTGGALSHLCQGIQNTPQTRCLDLTLTLVKAGETQMVAVRVHCKPSFLRTTAGQGRLASIAVSPCITVRLAA